MHEAINNNDAKTIMNLLAVGFDITSPFEEREDLLAYAVMHGSLKICKLLLEHGADATKNHLIVMASQRGNHMICKLLLDNGADVNDSYYGDTALTNASFSRNRELVALLVSRGANVNVRDINGDTPLHNAIKDRDWSGAKAIVGHGADINAKDNDGNTPIAIAKVGVTRELKI